MGGGQESQATTQSQNVTQLPPWVNTAAQQNYAFAQNVANRPLQQYQGQLVADPGQQMQQAWNTAAAGGNAGQSQYDASQAGYMGVMGQQPQQVQAGQLSNTNLQPYMNPYTQSVINSTLPIMQQNLGVQQAGNQAAAAQAGAYGGSRQALQQGVTQAQGAMGMAQMAAQLNQGNFQQAQGAAQQDIATNLAAQQANQNAQQNQQQMNLGAAGGLANIGNAAQANQVKNFQEQVTAGGLEQQQGQADINANQQQFNQAWNYPTQQLGVLQSALGMTPYGQASQGQSTTTQQYSPDYVSSALGGLGMLGSIAGMFSDRRMKTDIAKVGDHPAGVGIYSYRYKGDPKTYPKVVGPMAEDVAKIAPHAVSAIPGSGGKMMVDHAALNALAAPQSRRPAIGGPRGPMPMPGPLAAPMPSGPIGALGSTMRGPPPRIPRRRPPPLRGALGG